MTKPLRFSNAPVVRTQETKFLSEVAPHLVVANLFALSRDANKFATTR
jgi:hypothetical protein